MGKYAAPLWIFLGGMFVALLCFLFLPAIGDAGDALSTETADIASVFWNWSLINGSTVKFLVVGLIVMLTLFSSVKALLKAR